MKTVADTNLYIDWLNRRKHEEVLFHRGTVRYLSAVVMMELSAGAQSSRDRKLLSALFSAFRRAGRILLPELSTYQDAGEILQRLQAKMGYDVTGATSLANDVLIALSARSIGATVLTQNRADFEAIRKLRSFKLVVVSGA
ncbi:MAG TPA: PIN domain-containing protein [Thermoanaerobaculia bacterium]|nr:PIN domain-containing protein [Thermoanaerobaculia bacterium]